MEKVTRDGKVAVLISKGFGAGWSTWNSHDDVLVFHPKLVEMVEAGRQKEIDEEWVRENLGLEGVCCLGAEDLSIVLLPEGTAFKIDEYDGAESITTSSEFNLTT